MKHYTSSDFWAMYGALPAEIRELADKSYAMLRFRDKLIASVFPFPPRWAARWISAATSYAPYLR